MTVILFEDESILQMYPVTIGRPGFAISCGGLRLYDLVLTLSDKIRCLVRPHLKKVVECDFPNTTTSTNASTSQDSPTLLINAQVIPSVSNLALIQKLIDDNQPAVLKQGDRISAALLPPESPLLGEQLETDLIGDYLQGLNLESTQAEITLFEYPHDIVRSHLEIIDENMEYLLSRADYQEIEDGVFSLNGAVLGKYCVTDTTKGPIILQQGAKVGPYCYIEGPALLGENCKVIEHSAIKDAVTLGHTTKIGGEVEASIIEPYTNKQHHGFLGHSYLGSWINLGAGTCNSDLKNTYGKIKAEYDGKKIETDMQFFGCVIGDYSKTAINTSIFTGKVIGVCSMLYGFVTTNVPSYVNYARSFGQVTETPVSVMVSTQSRMFARRKVTQRPCDIELLHSMYELTHHERQLAGEPLSL